MCHGATCLFFLSFFFFLLSPDLNICCSRLSCLYFIGMSFNLRSGHFSQREDPFSDSLWHKKKAAESAALEVNAVPVSQTRTPKNKSRRILVSMKASIICPSLSRIKPAFREQRLKIKIFFLFGHSGPVSVIFPIFSAGRAAGSNCQFRIVGVGLFLALW